MKSRSRFQLHFSVLILCLLFCRSARTWAATSELRGYGKIELSSSRIDTLDLTTFTCDSPDKAILLLHKFGRDMEQTATVPCEWERVIIGGGNANVLVRAGIGAFLPAAIGSDLLIFTTPKTSDPAQAFAPVASKLQGARFFDPAYPYPLFYDKFSRVGIGTWYPLYWGGAFAKGHTNTVDEHFAYAQREGLTIQPGGEYTLRNLMPKIEEYARPYHIAQWLEWSQELALMAPEDLVVPGADFTTMPHYYGQISDGGHKLLQYRNWCFEDVMRQHINNPLLVDWVDPNGEVGPAPFFYYWDYSEGNRSNMVRYLSGDAGYTLQSLGTAWYGDPSRFKSWDEVKLPVGYDFFGYHDGDLLANKSWRIHPTSPNEDTDYQNGGWTSQTNAVPAYLQRDLASGYSGVGFDDSGWAEFSRPGGELASIYFAADSKHYNKSFWRRGTIDVPEQWLSSAKAAGRIYLSVIALNNNLGAKLPDRLWVNGIETAAISGPPGNYAIAQLDVTDQIKPGSNLIVHLANVSWGSSDGPYFLTTRKMEKYPFSDPLLNARYRDWRAYIAWCVNDKMEDTYKAMRAIDPDRPIKMMAASYKDLSLSLAAKYGCYPHNTGEGAFFRPWDKRYAFNYGIPSSAEFGGGVTDPAAWKRWLGWFMFEGNNAFDNFHDIQEMMYSPAKDLWVKYMPYLKLANRYDLKQPSVAFFRSSQNSELLPQQSTLSLDLGRGDFEFIGQSYAYVDETQLTHGFLEKYPVVWDCGTWIMDPSTVAGLKKYVENGGTFVALQETGRHTFIHRDAWPISDLTGFKVREIRPMTGTITILADQPLFKQLAGKNFDNRGKSIDYSGYNYADKCVVLEPDAPDTTAIARYDDGSIAIGMRKLGKGRVIVLGSPFWRDSYDGGGMWWPGESQCVFLEDLLDGLGVQPVARASTHDIWREHYLANNGTEEYLAVFNPFDTPRTFSVEWNTVKPAASLFDPRNGDKIDGKIDGNSVTLNNITLAGLETRIVATASARPPDEAVAAWFDHLALWSQPSAPGATLKRPDLPFYNIQLAATMTGKEVSTAQLAGLDLAALSRTADPGSGFELWKGQSYEALRDHRDPNRRFILHGSLTLPAKWKPADSIELVVSGALRQWAGKPEDLIDVYVNGAKVASHATATSAVAGPKGLEDGVAIDITKVASFSGPTSFCIVTGSEGFVGEIKLRRRPRIDQTLPVTGPFTVQISADGGTAQVAVPGIVKGLYAWRDVVIPASWKGSHVFIDVNVANLDQYDACAINDKVLLHPVGWYKPVRWMDVTPWVKFGEANRLTLISRPATKDWKPGSPEYTAINLCRIEAAAL
jgi:hypothetical protein